MRNRKQKLSWAMYDWANSAFATTVMAGFFPLFFKQYWAGELEVGESTFLLGNANALASVLVVVLAPILGAIADRGGAKKRFLLFFAMMGVVMTGALYMVAQGEWGLALVVYMLAVLGFSGSVVFYDSLLVDVAEEKELDMVSAIGFSFGYLGGGLLFAFDVMMTLYPQSFGLDDAAHAVRLSFLSVAIWWGVFSIPVMLFVKESRSHAPVGALAAVRGGFNQLWATFLQIRTLKVTFLFLLAYWLYIDGVDTVVRMAVDYGLSLGFDSNHLMLALLITQFVGFPAALVFGRLGERRGARQGIMIAIFVYFMVIIWAFQMQQVWEFYALAVTIGLVQGGIQALSRSFYARIIPKTKSGEFFGFYNMMGKFAAVLGPLMMGWVAIITQNPRISILSVLLLFIAGAILLALVDEEKGRQQVRAFEAKRVYDGKLP
ncbi:MAG: MFS transporter [Gammaproteobacteria bacterium]|nr:MFS transporter [Gammaproteobacteria bacterium]